MLGQHPGIGQLRRHHPRITAADDMPAPTSSASSQSGGAAAPGRLRPRRGPRRMAGRRQTLRVGNPPWPSVFARSTGCLSREVSSSGSSRTPTYRLSPIAGSRSWVGCRPSGSTGTGSSRRSTRSTTSTSSRSSTSSRRRSAQASTWSTSGTSTTHPKRSQAA